MKNQIALNEMHALNNKEMMDINGGIDPVTLTITVAVVAFGLGRKFVKWLREQ